MSNVDSYPDKDGKIYSSETPLEELFEFVIQPEYSMSILQDMKEKYNISDDDWSYILYHSRIITIMEQDEETKEFVKWKTGKEKG